MHFEFPWRFCLHWVGHWRNINGKNKHGVEIGISCVSIEDSNTTFTFTIHFKKILFITEEHGNVHFLFIYFFSPDLQLSNKCKLIFVSLSYLTHKKIGKFYNNLHWNFQSLSLFCNLFIWIIKDLEFLNILINICIFWQGLYQ